MKQIEEEIIDRSLDAARRASQYRLTKSQVAKHARKISDLAIKTLENTLYKEFPEEKFACLIRLTNTRREALFAEEFQLKLRKIMLTQV